MLAFDWIPMQIRVDCIGQDSSIAQTGGLVPGGFEGSGQAYSQLENFSIAISIPCTLSNHHFILPEMTRWLSRPGTVGVNPNQQRSPAPSMSNRRKAAFGTALLLFAMVELAIRGPERPMLELDPLSEVRAGTETIPILKCNGTVNGERLIGEFPEWNDTHGITKYRSFVLPADGCVQSTRTVQRYHPCVHDPDYVAPPGGYDPPYTIALSDSCEVRRDKVSAMYESWSSGRRYGGRRLRLDGRG